MVKRRRKRTERQRRLPSTPPAKPFNPEDPSMPTKPRTFRVNFVYGLFALSCVGLILRLSYLQITKSAEFRVDALNTSITTIPVLPARGRIYDTNGTLLAYDKPVYSVFYTQIPNRNTSSAQIAHLAEMLAPAFRTSPKSIEQTIEANTQYATVQLFINANNQQLAFVGENAALLPGISIQANSVRSYPYGDLAGQVLGYVGQITGSEMSHYLGQNYQRNQIVGQAGLELKYESYLQGSVGQQLEQVTGSGNVVSQGGYNPKPTPGYNLRLTLDARLQADTQEIVQKSISQYEAQNHTQIPDAAAVMLDVHTGAVLAMVSYPYLDPNWFISGSAYSQHANYLNTPGVQQNNAIENPHYPGSTVKPANMLTGLENGVITPTTVFDDTPGPLFIGTYPIGEDASYGLVNDIKAIAVSDDKFFYNLGLHLGKWFGSSSYSGGAPLGGFANLQHWRDTAFIQAITKLAVGEMRFGLGQLTGIDLPGEQPGVFYIENQQGYEVPLNVNAARKSLQASGSYTNEGSPSDLAFMAFGQSQQFTPIELAQYVAAIANGGQRLQPHLLEQVMPGGMYDNLNQERAKPIRTFKTVIQKTVRLNPKYLSIVRQGMYAAANQSDGTAYQSFFNAPYKAAGKTGTAGIVINGQKVDNSVFIGYAPYNNPQVAVAVMVPGAGFGAVTAVPIGRTMMDDYFDEHHASFMPKQDWTTTKVPAAWSKSSAYLIPERSH